MHFALALAGIFLASFLLGSIPWGVIISKVFYHTDVRSHGSGNIGTTNSFRAMGKVGGSAVFLLDFGKGIAAGVLALVAGSSMVSTGYISESTAQVLKAVAFFGAIEGHIYSPWLKFKGGKGIAVAVGAMFVCFGPIPATIELGVFAAVVAITKKISAGSLAAAGLCPIIALWVFAGNWLCWILITIAAVSVIWAHRENIERLRAGTESTITKKTSKESQ